MAIERVRDGEPPSEVICAYGFNRTTIYKWIQAASRPGVGVKALRSRPATGRPRSLTPRQEGQVFRWVNGRDPRQYGLDFGLWTRAVVAELVKQKFDVTLGLTAVGELLAKHGLTPQKPPQRAYQRDPQAVEKFAEPQKSSCVLSLPLTFTLWRRPLATKLNPTYKPATSCATEPGQAAPTIQAACATSTF
jgi:transposase